MLTHLLILATALATAPAEPLHAEPPAHPGAHAGEHPPAGAAGADHAAAGGHHAYYTDDDDHDGVPNWRDPMNGAVENTETYVLYSLGFHVFNFLLLAGVAVYFLRKPLADSFRERALGVRHELTDSARKRDEAHQRHQELLARLDRLQTEVKLMEQEGEAEARRDEQKLVERARRESDRIKEQAERNIRDETTRARTELRREAVELAVKLAEGTLRQGVGQADQQALARDFLTSMRDPKEAPRG
jgi:F-type H+-transporting ATPase subunit b